jgi:excisionase family DNA binding protein
MDHVTIAEAAHRLGVSVDTVKRKLRRGELRGYKQPGGRGGFSWVIEVGDSSQGKAHDNADASMEDTSANYYGEVKALRELVAMLQTQVVAQQKQIEQQLTSHQEELSAKNRQIEQLHVLLQQSQAALPAPREGRAWWRFWQR